MSSEITSGDLSFLTVPLKTQLKKNSIFHSLFNFPKKQGKCYDYKNAKNSNLSRLT